MKPGSLPGDSTVSIHVALNHLTRYDYDRAVTLGPQVIRLRPAPHCRSNVLAYSLKVGPMEHFVRSMWPISILAQDNLV